MSEMEHIKIQITKENIDFIKNHGSFAKVINFLVQEMKEDEKLKDKIISKINTYKV